MSQCFVPNKDDKSLLVHKILDSSSPSGVFSNQIISHQKLNPKSTHQNLAFYNSDFSIFFTMAIQGISLVVLVGLVSVVLAVLVTVLAVYFSRCWGNCQESRKGRITAAPTATV
jgi:hypothetical protein